MKAYRLTAWQTPPELREGSLDGRAVICPHG